MRTVAAALAVVVAALSVAGCGNGHHGAVRAVRYSSARKVIAAVEHGGLRCTDPFYGTPVVSGASFEATCNLNSSQQALIDVFPGTVTASMVLRNSVSTGTQKIWSDVGPNWWVQADRVYAERVQKILGGRLIGGPWTPTPPAPPPPPDPLTTWQTGRGYYLYQKVTAAMRKVSRAADANNMDALRADGKALYRAALAALKMPCPADRNGYKLEMVAFGAAGVALSLGKIGPAAREIRAGQALISSVNAACGF